jgi:hypothetical protein
VRGRPSAGARRSVVGTPADWNTGSSNGNTTASGPPSPPSPAARSGMPRPHLRRDVVEHSRAAALELGPEPQVEAG